MTTSIGDPFSRARFLHTVRVEGAVKVTEAMLAPDGVNVVARTCRISRVGLLSVVFQE